MFKMILETNVSYPENHFAGYDSSISLGHDSKVILIYRRERDDGINVLARVIDNHQLYVEDMVVMKGADYRRHVDTLEWRVDDKSLANSRERVSH